MGRACSAYGAVSGLIRAWAHLVRLVVSYGKPRGLASGTANLQNSRAGRAMVNLGRRSRKEGLS